MQNINELDVFVDLTLEEMEELKGGLSIKPSTSKPSIPDICTVGICLPDKPSTSKPSIPDICTVGICLPPDRFDHNKLVSSKPGDVFKKAKI